MICTYKPCGIGSIREENRIPLIFHFCSVISCTDYPPIKNSHHHFFLFPLWPLLSAPEDPELACTVNSRVTKREERVLWISRQKFEFTFLALVAMHRINANCRAKTR